LHKKSFNVCAALTAAFLALALRTAVPVVVCSFN